MIDAEILPVPTQLPPSLMRLATLGADAIDDGETDSETLALLDTLDGFLDRLDAMAGGLRQLGIVPPTATTGIPGHIAVPV